MMNQKHRKRIHSKLFYVIAAAIFTFLLTRIAIINPDIVEAYYSKGIYPKIATVLAFFSQQLPFSLADLFYAVLLVMPVILIGLVIIRRTKIISALKCVLAILSLVYTLFYFCWGFNYYRTDINKRLSILDAEPNVTELMQVFEWLIDETNKAYTPIYTINKSDIENEVRSAYALNAEFLNIDSALLIVPSKPITLSRLFAAATISGYYGPFLSEVHINDYLLPQDYPTVFAHEMAHRLGVTSEAEANFYAWFVCNQSSNTELRYSANLYLLRYFVYATYKYPQFKSIVSKIRYEVRFDYYKTNFHWMALMDEDVELVATKMNDAYLKSNNIEEGIEDYEGVVKYVMDYKMQ